MERKIIELETKTIEDRTVTGFASIFGNIDSYADITHFGAFKKTLKEQGGRIKHLWMHDPMQPPTAVIKSMAEVGRDELPSEVQEKFPEAKGGLKVVREYLRTPRGDEILEGIKSGAINEMSFAYDPVKWDIEEIDEDGHKVGIRNLREVRLWETSDVTWGANPATVASKFDGPGRSHLELATASLHDMLNVKAGRVLNSRNLQRLKDALAVLEDILLSAEPQDEDDQKARQALTEAVMQRLAIAEHDPILLKLRS